VVTENDSLVLIMIPCILHVVTEMIPCIVHVVAGMTPFTSKLFHAFCGGLE